VPAPSPGPNTTRDPACASLGFFGFSTCEMRPRQGPPPASLLPRPAAAAPRVGLCPGDRPDPSVAALGLGRRGSPESPAAACQNWPLGFGEIVRCYFSVPEDIRLPEPGPQFREGRSLFWPGARVGLLVPRFAFPDRLGRIVPGSTGQGVEV
jgi:hypothetical protein